MVQVLFEIQGQTFDDENGVLSGWSDVRLTQLGMDQSKQLGARAVQKNISAVFKSDLKRAEQTATLGFDLNPAILFTDWRLRECNYGELAQTPWNEYEQQKQQYVSEPHTGGESYLQMTARLGSFLKDVKAYFDGTTVLVIGDRSTYAALEYLLKGIPLEQTMQSPWQWQPGWEYQIQ